MLIYCLLPEPPHFSLPSTFNLSIYYENLWIVNDCNSTVHWFSMDLGSFRYRSRVGTVHTILVQYLVLKCDGNKFSCNYWAHWRCLFFFFNFEQSNFSGHREESLWGGGNGRKGTASYSFICWFLMMVLVSLLEWLIDWRFFYKFMGSCWNCMIFLKKFQLFFCC